MRKKILSMLIGFMVLAAGCPLKSIKISKTILTIKNESAVTVKNIKYDGKEAIFSENSGQKNLLMAGGICNVNLNREAKGYIFFTVFNAEKKINIPVRTNEIVIVEKGKSSTCVLTDNMLVVPVGKTAAVKLLNLVNPAVLKVCNETSWDITEISYGGKTHKETLASGGEWETSFSESMSGELKIKILQKSDNSIISLKLKDSISIEIGNIKELKISSTTLAIQDGKTEIAEIRQLLGAIILKIVNQSSAKAISDISYAGISKGTLLSEGDELEIESTEKNIEDFIHFKVKTEITEFDVKTIEKIKLDKGSRKTFIITDKISVVLKDKAEPTKVAQLVNASIVEIANETYSTVLTDLTYGGIDFGQVHDSGQKIILNFEQIPDHIHFTIYHTASGKTIKLKTAEIFSIKVKSTAKFILTSISPLINEETSETTSIRKLFGLTAVKIINQSSALSIFDISYANKPHSEDLPKGNAWVIEFDRNIEEPLNFKIKTDFADFEVSTADKIKTASGEEIAFTITDETSVIPLNNPIPTKIISLINASLLEISNNSSAELINIKYDNCNFGVLSKDTKTSVSCWDFNQNASSVYFEIRTPSKLFKVRTADVVLLVSRQKSIFTIDNSTQVIVTGTNETLPIRNILGITELKIINQTSANKISNLTFAGETLKDLPKGGVWSIEFNTPIENNLFFTIETEISFFEVNTKEKIQLINRDRIFTITDGTLVILKGRVDAFTISNFLDAASLAIDNKSTFAMFNVTYDGGNLGSIQRDCSTGDWRFWGFTMKISPISFEIYVNSQAIRLTTHESIELRPRWNIKYTITDSTLVKYNGRVVRLGSFAN